jgi:hypothetical protein
VDVAVDDQDVLESLLALPLLRYGLSHAALLSFSLLL